MDRPDKNTAAAIPETQNQCTSQGSDELKEANSQTMAEKR